MLKIALSSRRKSTSVANTSVAPVSRSVLDDLHDVARREDLGVCVLIDLVDRRRGHWLGLSTACRLFASSYQRHRRTRMMGTW